MKNLGYLLIGLCLTLSFAQCAYDENLAVEMVYASALAYCPSDKVMSGGCKAATSATENVGIHPVFSISNGDSKLPIYMSILKREDPQQIIVGFSGTKGAEELMTEVTHILPKDYKIHSVKNAQVFTFFYEHYVDEFMTALQEQLSNTLSEEISNGYTVIFTGHSLGGAMTLHAAADAILGGIVPAGNVQIYTFGQPRVGNAEFLDSFIPQVAESYRIVHHDDIVPHLPPCVTDLNDGCIRHGVLIPVFPYHMSTEVFYQKDFTSYKVCSSTEGEDNTCSDAVKEPSIEDHLEYFGVHVGQYHTHDSQSNGSNKVATLMN